MRTAWIGCTLVLASVLLAPAAARAQARNACEPQAPSVGRGGWVLDVTYRAQGAARRTANLRQIKLVVHYLPLEGHQALVFFLGGAHVRDGTSNTFLVGEDIPSPSCADTDADGLIGIVGLQFLLRDVRTGELVPGFIVPNDGELDDDGEEDVTIVIGGLTVAGTAVPRFWVFGTELPP